MTLTDSCVAQGPIADAVRDGVLPGRVWLYSNYHCNQVVASVLRLIERGVRVRIATTTGGPLDIR